MAKHHDVSKADTHLQTALGLVIRARRRELGITQEELAWRASMHRTYIADIERGARNVTLRSIVNLTKALQVTVGDLLSYAIAPSGTAKSTAMTAAAPIEGAEILLIEDSATDAALTARAFKLGRVTNPLRIARDAEEGLEFLFGTGRYEKRPPAPPQLILLDLNLPQMSGVEFLRRIKEDARTSRIPVVVLTVSQSDRMIIECGRLGARNYIVKPIGLGSIFKITPKLNLSLTLSTTLAAPTKANPG